MRISPRRLKGLLKQWAHAGHLLPEGLTELLREYDQQVQQLEQEKKILTKSLAAARGKANDDSYRLNTFLESTDAVYYILYKNNPHKNFISSHWYNLFGFDPAREPDPLQARLSRILSSSVAEYQAAMQVLDVEGTVTIKYQVEHAKNHKQRWLEEEIKKKYDPVLEDEVLTGRIVDVSGVEYYREYIVESENRFKRVTDSLPVMVWVSDQNHIVTYTNDKTKEFFGVSMEEMKGQFDFAPLVHPDYRKMAIQGWSKKLQRHEPIDGVFMVKGHDGAYHYLHEVAVPRFLGSGKFVGYIGAYFDLTREYQYQKELEADKQQFDLIAQNSSDVTVITNWKGIISYISPGVFRLLGYHPEELKDVNLYEHVSADCRAALQTRLSKKNLQEGKLQNHSFQMLRRNRELIWAEVAVQSVHSSADINQNLLFHIRDVTRIRAMERQLTEERINQEKYILEAKLQAEEDQRSQIGRDLHDGVGQMLAYMSLLLNMMKEKASYDPEDIDRLRETVAQTLEQVRTLARTLAPPAIRDLGLRDSVVELIDSYGILTRPSFTLKVYPQPEDARINLDKKIVVFRVLQELLNNTFKYANADNISIHLYFTDGSFHMEYKDDGKGFDPETIKKGVGLDSMRSRIAFYKGNIEIRSAPGKGTETNIQLPID